MKRHGRARFVTTGKPVEDLDDKHNVTREQPDVSDPPGPVDYEKLWKNLRYDSGTFWTEFMKVQGTLCGACLKKFTDALQSAQKKAFGEKKR